jgi:hypothetical protein
VVAPCLLLLLPAAVGVAWVASYRHPHVLRRQSLIGITERGQRKPVEPSGVWLFGLTMPQTRFDQIGPRVEVTNKEFASAGGAVSLRTSLVVYHVGRPFSLDAIWADNPSIAPADFKVDDYWRAPAFQNQAAATWRDHRQISDGFRNGDVYAFRLPYALLFLMAAFPALTVVFVRVVRAARIAHRLRSGRCPKCGYLLRGSPDRCPECSTPAAASPASPRPT